MTTRPDPDGSSDPERDAPPGGSRSNATPPVEAGDPVCWAHLVCPDCGAVTTEGHRPGCKLAATPDASE
jgi:hypothetical protein